VSSTTGCITNNDGHNCIDVIDDTNCVNVMHAGIGNKQHKVIDEL